MIFMLISRRSSSVSRPRSAYMNDACMLILRSGLMYCPTRKFLRCESARERLLLKYGERSRNAFSPEKSIPEGGDFASPAL